MNIALGLFIAELLGLPLFVTMVFVVAPIVDAIGDRIEQKKVQKIFNNRQKQQ